MTTFLAFLGSGVVALLVLLAAFVGRIRLERHRQARAGMIVDRVLGKAAQR